MNLSSLTIRSLSTVEELQKVRNLEVKIWSMEDSVSVNHTIAAIKNGGLVIGAFLNENLVGFQYSFPGYDGKKVYLCSHSLGIDPEYRKFGIGEKLKIAQREVALEKGYDLITWTYDPLETVNGYLNLHKLRAVCSSYLENAYGDMDDNLNGGLPTDRFLVEWHIKDPVKKKTISVEAKPPVAITTSVQNGYLVPEKNHLDYKETTIVVPVPGNFQELKKYDFTLALLWREMTREVFSHYLQFGWTVTDLRKDDEIEQQYLYVLHKKKVG
ncbi:GNAT family N-acetyltransferase [Anaerobacillus isosaccharinicus]|uniref:GNAT family N-acetyltransferase n=1 Tax=Anaerobacillus isosaccharinicus TaxID=1532552 RepID=A0A1S2M0I4_9BACI|nr:GNAT family N-acetyltransferase [Anaerobacillus isosaccharinicus]MBA5586551.1 GNAT family N-acetyltransferase [Anaerobacillus isosaccharinicus]QOY35210.1 GNAT family N-acetyltransferase [Anaerobacillus isosaccharinicus]